MTKQEFAALLETVKSGKSVELDKLDLEVWQSAVLRVELKNIKNKKKKK